MMKNWKSYWPAVWRGVNSLILFAIPSAIQQLEQGRITWKALLIGALLTGLRKLAKDKGAVLP